MNEQQEIEENDDLDQETSLREDMEAAMSEVDEREDNLEDDNVEETPEVEKNEEKGAENVDSSPEPKGKKGGNTGGDKQGSEEGAVKAPQSWSPKLREDFAKLPPSVQTQINKRETEMTTFLNEGAESRKFGDKMNQTLQPYSSVMAAHGTNDPVQAVQGLMETAAMLQMGNPQQKAQKLAEMVQHYNIDINALDQALSGQPHQTSEQSQIEQMLEQKLAPMNQFMNNVQSNQHNAQQQIQNNATNEVGQFEKEAEFIDDVRLDMADLLDMAAKNGQEMTLKQAYDKACAINPEISSVLQQRSSDDIIKGNIKNNSNKRYAASSIRGSQVGGGNAPVNDSIEAALNQAWDDQSRS